MEIPAHDLISQLNSAPQSCVMNTENQSIELLPSLRGGFSSLSAASGFIRNDDLSFPQAANGAGRCVTQKIRQT